MGYFDSIYSTKLPHRAVTVYMYLKARTNKDGICWPGIRTMCKDLKISRATVQRALRELEKNGWITKSPRHRENGSCTSNLYKIIK